MTQLMQNQNPDKSLEGGSGVEADVGVGVGLGVSKALGVGVGLGVGKGNGMGIGNGLSCRSCLDVGALAARASAGADGGDRARTSMSNALLEVRRAAGSCYRECEG